MRQTLFPISKSWTSPLFSGSSFDFSPAAGAAPALIAFTLAAAFGSLAISPPTFRRGRAAIAQQPDRHRGGFQFRKPRVSFGCNFAQRRANRLDVRDPREPVARRPFVRYAALGDANEP